jgi:hypothetical protein
MMDRTFVLFQYQSGNFGMGSNTNAASQATSLISGLMGSDSIFTAASGILSATAEDLFTNTASSLAAQTNFRNSRLLA